jgi:hypothetical protein
MMSSRNSLREKVLIAGTFLAFVGVGGLAFSSQHGIPRIAASCCLIVGYLLNCGAFVTGAWDRSQVIQSVKRSPIGMVWIRILLIVMWLGILPFVLLRLYDYLHRLQP